MLVCGAWVGCVGVVCTLRARLSLLFRMSSMTRRSYGARPGGMVSVSVVEIFRRWWVVEEENIFLDQDYHRQIMIVLTTDFPHNISAEGSTLAKMSFGLDAVSPSSFQSMLCHNYVLWRPLVWVDEE
jgi:hypothetical protein